MRHTILLIAAFLLGAMNVQAQVTIDQNNFPSWGQGVDTFIVSGVMGNPNPQQGENQVWDYSNLTRGGISERTLLDATNDPDFPNAITSYSTITGFEDFVIFAEGYDGLDANGFYDLGIEIFEISYPLLTLTGGQNDTVTFVGEKRPYSARYDYVKFPSTYGTTWSANYNENINFLLTVNTFGLNKTPGYQETNISASRDVVGYGQLIIPTRNGSPSAPMDVLMLKETRIFVDSFFLGGAPAPQTLLNTFGITQGRSKSDSAYYFYRPGYYRPLLKVGLSGSPVPDDFFFRPQGALLTTSVDDELKQEAINIFPNPASQGQKVQFQADLPAGQGSIQLYDTQGRIVDKMNIQPIGQGHYESTLPASLPSGTYFYFVQDQHGAQKGMGKLLVQ